MDMKTDGDPGAETPGFHGMALVGQRRAYLSHLPMFMVQHRYQAIFEVTLDKEGIDAFGRYIRDVSENPPGSIARPDTSSTMYGFQPVIGQHTDDDPLDDLFVLTDLVTPSDPADPASPPIRTAFRGDIYRGHFETFHVHEKAGPLLLKDVVATVTSAVVLRTLDAAAEELPELEYILFGSAEDLYLAHTITRPPDFDQIVSVGVRNRPLPDEDLRHGIRVTFPGRPNTEDHKLGEGETVTGRMGDADVTFTVGTQDYFETDDLSSAM